MLLSLRLGTEPQVKTLDFLLILHGATYEPKPQVDAHRRDVEKSRIEEIERRKTLERNRNAEFIRLTPLVTSILRQKSVAELCGAPAPLDCLRGYRIDVFPRPATNEADITLPRGKPVWAPKN